MKSDLRWAWPAAALAAMVLAAASGIAHAACLGAAPPLGSAEIAQAIDGRTLRLADGREVRLAGLAPWPAGRQALAQFAGHRVTLHGADAPDRYGRQSLIVVPEAGGPSLQARLLADGAAAASGLVPDPGCAAELAAAEDAARAARRGIWSAADAIKNAEKPGDILAKLGHFAIVEGRVRSVRTAGATVYVNFGRRWLNAFAVTIPGRATAAFTAAGRAPASLAGRTVRVRGIVARRGGPRIEAANPGQIELMDAPAHGAAKRREQR